MFESIPSYFHTNISLFIFLGIALLAALVSYTVYRRTIPPISKGWAIFLGSIRGITVTGICLLIFAPEVTLVWKRSQKNKTIMVLDKSASMGIVEGELKRLERANTIAREIIDKIEDKTHLQIYAFNTDTARVFGNLPDTADAGTDIYKALNSILKQEQGPETVILMSDGNFTSGRNPLYADFFGKTRIFTIGIGDTVDVPDLLITDARYNKIVYQNKPSQVEVDIMMRGLKQTVASLTLKHRKKVIGVKQVELTSSGTISTLPFEMIPEQIGLNNYEIELSVQEGETLTENNKYIMTIDVLKGKIHVGLVAAQPNFDVKFLRLILSNIEDLNLKTAVLQKGTQTFLASIQDILDSIDVLILHDIPSQSSHQQYLSQIEGQILNRKLPSFIILNERVSSTQIKFINNFFPVTSINHLLAPLNNQVQTTEESQFLPLLSVFQNMEDNDDFWLKCPPIEYPFSQVNLGSGCKILLQIQAPVRGEQKQAPVLVLNQSKGRKSLLLLGAGFWRWHFLLAEDRKFNGGWSKMLHNMIRWLGSATTDENVIVSTKEKSYQVGERIQINTQVYDGSYNAVDAGVVRLQISGPGGLFEEESKSVGNGVYLSKFVPIASGDYEIEAGAWLNDVKLGSSKTKVYVTPVNAEFIYTKQDYRLLQQLAEESGGRYFSEETAGQILNYLDLMPQSVQEEKTFKLWHKMVILLTILFLLTLEWFIRKRKGLA
jgi:hypothetical protein